MTPSTTHKLDDRQLREFAIDAARLLADNRCEDVRLLDVTGLSQVCDYILIGSGTSDRQVRSVSQKLGELGKERGEHVFRSSRDDSATWVVTDFVDLVVHVFAPSHRAYYDLEGLWADGRPVDWKRS